MPNIEAEKIFSEALDDFENKNYARAVYLFTKAAEMGLAKAQYNLGLCYYDAHGVEQDYAQAAAWYEKAAVQGHVRAQFNIGICYVHGRGVEQDAAKGVEWFRKAAEQGDVNAICNLGNCYYHGIGVANDDGKAIELFSQAAEKGDSFAMYNMGNAYLHGRGVTQDEKIALEWIVKSAAAGNPEAQKIVNEATQGDYPYKVSFNYMLSHQAIPMCIFRDLDYFYENIITNPTNLQIYLQNWLLTATAWAQKGAPDVEPGYAIERFEMGIFGNSLEHSVIVIDIPHCNRLNDCYQIAIPTMREKAGYFTCEVSSNPLDDSVFIVVGEWKPDGEDGSLKHLNHGKLDHENGENFPGKVIKMVYGVEYKIPDVNKDLAEYNLLRAKLNDMDEITTDTATSTQILNSKEFGHREPLFHTENYYDILENSKGELLFCIRVRGGEPRMSELFYSGGKNALLRRRIDQYVVLDEVHEGIREKLGALGSSGNGEVLIAEFIPAEEKTALDKDKGIIREYTVPVRRLPDIVSFETIPDIRDNGYVMFNWLAALARKHTAEGKRIAEVIPPDELPTLAAILAFEEDYALLDKYIAEKLPLNQRCSRYFKSWQPTPLFYITTYKVWSCLKEPEKILRYLIQHGANINLASAEGDTPLGNLCYAEGNAQTMKALLEAGADPNVDTVSQGNTLNPLILVLSPPPDYDLDTHIFTPQTENVIERAKLLIEFGADVNATFDSQITPLALALTYSAGELRKELVTLLRSKGAEVDTALKCMEKQAEYCPEYYYALYEYHAESQPETALRYLQLSAEKGYGPAKALLAEFGPQPDCLD